MGDRISQTVSQQGIGIVQGNVYLGDGPYAFRLLPGRSPFPEHPAPSHYLVARHEIVPFAGQEALLADLDTWAATDHDVRVRLLTGPGGAGKTRLALEWITRRIARGELAGFAGPLDPATIRAIAEEKAATVVIDYGETREALPDLMRELAARRDESRRGRLRVLLLARGVGDWWSELSRRDGAVDSLLSDGPEPQDLPLVEVTDRAREFRRAAEAFAARREWTAMPPVPDLSDDRFARALYLHMAAWQAGESRNARSSADELPDRLLDHEARFWLNQAWFEVKRPSDKERRFLKDAEAAVAALALRGGARDKEHLSRVLAATRDKKTRRLLAEVLRALYPGTGQLLVAPLEPDLLAEALVIRVLRRQTHWLSDAVGDADAAELQTAFTVLARAESLNPEVATAAESRLLDGHLATRAVPAFEAILGMATRSAHVRLGLVLARALEAHGTPALAMALEPRLPEQTVQLREVGAWVNAYLRDRLIDPADRAGQLTNLGGRLISLGRYEEALAATAEAIAIDRDLGQPGHVGLGLNNLSLSFAELGRWEEARAAAQESVEIRRRLLDSQSTSDRVHDLAVSLLNLGRALHILDRPEALPPTTEAVERLRALARVETFEPNLAMGLNNLGYYLSTLGRLDEALVATREAVTLIRRLAVTRPDAFEPQLALGLRTLGNCLSTIGESEQALAATTEAVDLFRRLAHLRPRSFLSDLVKGLDDLGHQLSALGRHEEALAVIAEHRQHLALEHPEACEPELAKNLLNAGSRLSDLGRFEEALSVTMQAVDLYRGLAAARPEAFDALLADGLNNLGRDLLRRGRLEPAAAASSEAAEIYRRLAHTRPRTFQAGLSKVLHNLAIRLVARGRLDDGLDAATEAVALRRELAHEQPAVFEPELALSISVRGDLLTALGRRAEARAAAEEALDLLWPHFLRHAPAVFADHTAMLLSDCLRLADPPSAGLLERRRIFEKTMGGVPVP